MSLVDRLVYRFIHRNRHGDTDRVHDEIGGADHGHARDAHRSHEHGDPLTEPGRFGGQHAERYAKESRSRSRRRFYRRIASDVAALAPESGRVLDVGTGPGGLMIEIARARPDGHVTGVDVEPAMVRLAGRLAAEQGLGERVRVLAADVSALPLGAGTVDVAVASLTAHHWPDVPAAVAELVRVLRPGGVLLVVDFRSAVDRPLTAAVAAVDTGATIERRVRWAWGLPALTVWRVRLSVA